jgi:hypothetical protein
VNPDHPTPPVTGDAAVDGIVADLDRALRGDPEHHLEAVGEAHRRLQARLSAPPGPARPQPRPGPAPG